MSAAADVAVPDGLAPPRRHWALAGLWIAMAMTVIDGSVVNIALPAMAGALSIRADSAVWIVTAYQIALVMLLLPMAALGERLGYRRVYMGGLSLFVLASFACALARSLELLAALRFLQGMGAAAVMSVNGALMRFTWPRALLGRGLGYNAMVVAGAAAAGPALGGLVLAVADWPWLFFLNVPLGAVALILLVTHAPRTAPETRSFDGIGAVLSAVMFGTAFLAISDGAHGHWSPWLALTVPACLLSANRLMRRSRARPRPMLPLDLIAIARLRMAYGASVCAFAAQMSLLVMLPFLLEAGYGVPVATVALVVLPWPLGLICISPLAGRAADRPWAGRMSAGGLILFAAMLALTAMLVAQQLPIGMVAAAMALSGVGFGLFQAPNNNVMLRTGPVGRAGAAAGMLALCRLIGQTVGALIAAVALRLSDGGSTAALFFACLLALVAAGLSSRR